MKKTLFIMTHAGSGWRELVQNLETCPAVHVFTTGRSYHHPEDVDDLTTNIHRRHNRSAVWADVIMLNKDFTMKRLCEHYHAVFWWRPFEECDGELYSTYKGRSRDHWESRTEGMRQYARRFRACVWNPDLDGESLLEAVLG